jgi:hypothetical protein
LESSLGALSDGTIDSAIFGVIKHFLNVSQKTSVNSVLDNVWNTGVQIGKLRISRYLSDITAMVKSKNKYGHLPMTMLHNRSR